MINRTKTCPYCQSEISSASDTCPNCGAPVTPDPPKPVPIPAYQPHPEKAVAPGKGMAVAGLITGIVGFLISWLPFFGVVMIVPALILNVVAIRRNPPNKGIAVAGLILAGIALLFNLVLILAYLAEEGF